MQVSDAYGHTTLNAPVLVWSPKLSSVGPAKYLDGWPPGNRRCCRLRFFFSSCGIWGINRPSVERPVFVVQEWRAMDVPPLGWGFLTTQCLFCLLLLWYSLFQMLACYRRSLWKGDWRDWSNLWPQENRLICRYVSCPTKWLLTC